MRGSDEQRRDLEVGLVERQVEERDVGVALAHAVDQLGEVERPDLDADVRVQAPEAREQRREDAARRRAERADDQRAGLAAGQGAAAIERVVGVREDPSRVDRAAPRPPA